MLKRPRPSAAASGRLGRGGRAHRSGADVAATGAATAGASIAAAAEARTSRTGAEALTSGASGSAYNRTFWPGAQHVHARGHDPTAGREPAMTIASLPSAPPTCTGCGTAVIDAGSTIQTDAAALVLLQRRQRHPGDARRAVARRSPRVAVWPSRGAVAALPRSALTRKVRVTGSAAAEISRIVAGTSLPVAAPEAHLGPGLTRGDRLTSATLSSGTEKTTSRGPSCARRSTGAPAATTMPGSTSTPVITPLASAISAA